MSSSENPDIPDTELVVPKLSKTVGFGHHPVFSNPAGTKSLFATKLFDNTAEEYEIVKPINEKEENLLHAQSPALLAFRKGTSRPATKSTSRATTSLVPSAAQMMPSLISKRPLSNLREPTLETEAIEKERELEEQSIAFKEDPIAYFSKRKDGRGHLFIYMIYVGDKSDPAFNPYELKKVSSQEIGNDYFTMSASGVTHVMPDGSTENLTLDRWSKESSIFMAIRKLRTFSNYFRWKPFRIWKKFVMQQRFDQITDRVLMHSFFNNYAFYEAAIQILENTCDTILKKHLLCFNTQKNYPLATFLEISSENIEALKSKFAEFVEKVIAQLVQLDTDIRDPARVIVEDSDFPEIKRRNPNLGQLMVLERKKYAESNRRNEIVKKEIGAFGHFVRLVDYVLLEQLAKSCYECWIMADENVSTDQSSIFEIQVSFNSDGTILFTPSIDEFITKLRNLFSGALKTLNELPRVIRAGAIRQHLCESLPNLNFIFDDGPSFKSFIDCNAEIERLSDHIINVITEAYHDAYEVSQQFKDYFPIFQIGEKWSPKIYIKERSTEPKEINLAFGNSSPFIFKPNSELIIDFQKIRDDYEQFKQDEIKMNQFRSCTLRGALYVDSKNMKNHLRPIPARAIMEMQKMLQNLVQTKVDYFQSIFNHCHKYLRFDPTSLTDFVDFCEFSDKCDVIEPYLQTEVKFVDQCLVLFDEFHIHVPQLEKNPLIPAFNIFKGDQQIAQQTKSIHSAVYINTLENQIRVQLEKLTRVQNTVSAIPVSIQQCDVDMYIPTIQQMKAKITKYQPRVVNLQHYQQILGVNKNDFSIFAEIKKKAEFDGQLYDCVASWKGVSKIITTVPLSNVDIQKFKEDLENIDQTVQHLKENYNEPCELLAELDTAESAIVPYIEVIELLSQGRMQTHHWNTLFESCGRPNAYYSQIKIDELISLGILQQKEKIQQITSTSQGESRLEHSFQAINSHWQEVHIPLLDIQDKKEDELMLGNLDSLFAQIADTQEQLDQMLSVPFVQGIKDHVLSLSFKLENIARILDEWLIFQSNWPLLSRLFNNDDIKSVLPACVQKFQIVKKRWSLIIKNTLEDTLLFVVCAFPQLHDILKENNNTLQWILSQVHKYIDTKRALMPRLYFLSNQEVLNMITTDDFQVFNSTIAKMFMHIKNFDSNVIDEKDTSDGSILPFNGIFSKYRLTGLVGDDGDTLPFTKPVQISGDVDEWGPRVIEAMQNSVKDSIGSSIARFTSSSMKDWIPTVSTHIAILTLQVSFAREIQECFNNTDNPARAFSAYEQVLQSKIVEISSVMSSPLSSSEILKLSAIATFLNFLITQIGPLSEQYHYYSQELNWNSHMRFRYHNQNQTMFIDMGDATVEHGYEFWGSSIQYIYTPASERVLNNAANAIMHNKFPMICGAEDVGKKHLIAQLANNFGRFIYFFPAFQNTPTQILSRIVTGAALTGCWLSFNNVEKLSHHNLSFIYQIIHSMNMLQNAGGSRITISDRVIELQKSCRILLSGNASFMTSASVPPELRTILKPVSFAAPDCLQIANVKLVSSGFKFTKIIAVKLSSCINAITRTFTYLKNESFMSYVFVILDQAHDLLRQMMHSKSASFVNYYEEPRIAEEFVVARAIYLRFFSNIKFKHRDLLMEMIYANFHIFENINVFKDHITKPQCFHIEQAAEVIRDVVSKELKNMEDQVDTEYIIKQVIRLYEMMLKYPCIIICGGPNSGKTLIVHMLELAFLKLAQNADIINRFSGIMPVKICDVFQESEKYKVMFGSVKDDPEEGQIQNYGLLNTYVSQLKKFEKTHHCILRFNGPMSTNFVSYLQEFFSTSLSHKCKLNTLDTLLFDHKFHIIVETGNLSNISPSFVACCGIIPMKEFITPLKMFNQVSLPSEITLSCKECLSKIFVEVIPKVTNYLTEELKGYIPELRDNFKKYMMKDALPRKALEYTSMIIVAQQVNQDDENSIKIAFLHSVFKVFCGLLTEEAIKEFDQWMLHTYEMSVPTDWDGLNVPEICTQKYPTPSLISLRFFKDKLIPLDFDLTLGTPTNSAKDSDVQMRVEDIAVCTPEMMPMMAHISVLIRNKQNIFLHGQQGSGKTAFLHQIFSKEPNLYIPIFIPVTPSSTGRSLLEFIRMHTPVITKNYAMMKTKAIYALIFEDVPFENQTAAEFIRQIITTKSLVFSSKVDPKYYEEYPIRNTFIIVTAKSPKRFGRRFMKHFHPIHFLEQSPSSLRHIFRRGANSFSISNTFIDLAIKVFENFQQKGLKFNMNQILQPFPFYEEKYCSKKEDILLLIRALIGQSYFAIDPQTEEESNKIRECFREVLSNDYGEILGDFANNIVYRTLFNSDDHLLKLNCKLVYDDIKTTIERLSQEKDAANQKFAEKISFVFDENTVQQYIRLERALAYPSGSVYISGKSPTGRRTLTRLFCQLNNFEFFDLKPLVPIQNSSKILRREMLKKTMANAINLALLQNKSSVIFLRATDDTELEQLALHNFLHRSNFTEFYNAQTLEELYKTYTKSQTNLSSEEALKTYYKIRAIIRDRVHVCVSVDNVQEYPKFAQVFELRFSDEICNDEVFITRLPEEHKSLANCFTRVHNFMKLKLGDKITSNLMNDFSVYFKRVYEQRNTVMETLKRQRESTGAFFDKVSNELQITLNKIKETEPQLQNLRNKSQSSSEDYKNQLKEVTEREENLNKQEKEKVDEIEELKKQMETALHNKQDYIQDFNMRKSKLNALTDNDLQILQISAENPPLKFKVLMRVLCSLLNVDIDYDTSGKVILMKPDFPTYVANSIDPTNTNKYIDKNNPTDMNIGNQACQFFNTAQITQIELDTISPPAGFLFAFVQSCIKILSSDILYFSKSKTLAEKEKALEEFRQDTTQDRKEIAEIKEKLENQAANNESQSQELEKFEETFKKLNADKVLLEEVCKDSEKFVSRVVKGEDMPESSLISDSFFEAAYRTYGGYMNQEQLDDFFSEIKEIMQQNNQQISGNDMEFRTAVGIAFTVPDLPPPESQKKTSFHVELAECTAHSTLRIPLIIDQDGFVCHAIESHNKGSVVHICALSSSLEKTISQAMVDGKIVFVHDVDDYNPLFDPIFAYYYNSQHENAQDVTIGQTTVNASPRFKIFFLSSKKSVNELPVSLLSRTSVINGNLGQLDAAKLELTRIFVRMTAPENEGNVMSERLFELRRNVTIQRLTMKLLQLISESQCDDMEKLAVIAKEKDALVKVISCFVFLQSDILVILMPVKQTLDLVTEMWTVASVVLPKITGNSFFRFHTFTSCLTQAINQNGGKAGKLEQKAIEKLHQGVIAAMLKLMLQPLTMTNALLYMFFVAIAMRKVEGSENEKDLQEVVNHIEEVGRGKVDVNISEALGMMTDAIDALKTSNVADVFNLFQRVISEQFTANFAVNYPTFPIESFITTTANQPVFIYSDIKNDPTSLLSQFVANRNRLDSFETFSLSEDSSALEKIVSTIQSMMNKSVWVALHYSDPTPAAASALADIYAALQGTTSSNFRMIIIAQSTKYIPSYVLSGCTRYSYNSYPSIRQQMLQIYQHYSNSIRSSTNPRAMKKYSYAAALMFSVVHFRSSLGILGFSEFSPVPEVAVKDIFERLRTIIDANAGVQAQSNQTQPGSTTASTINFQHELPIRNVRDEIMEMILSSSTLDTFDRRKLRVIIFTIFAPEAVDDNFRFIDESFAEREQWVIPPDSPISNYQHTISKMTVFNTCDILSIPRVISGPIRAWLLGQDISNAIAPCTNPIKRENGIQNIKIFLNDLPKIEEPKPLENITPTIVWAQHELKELEEAINSARTLLQKPSKEIISSFAKENLPKEIINIFNYSGTFNPKKMIENIKGRIELLKNWVENGRPPTIDISLVSDVRGLILSYSHEVAVMMNVVVDSLMIDFEFNDSPTHPNALNLDGIYLMAGNYDSISRKLIPTNQKSKPFVKMPRLSIALMKRTPRDKRVYMCPLFKSAPSFDCTTTMDRRRVDGEIENLIRYIPIPSDVSDKNLIASGTSLICHIPEVFV
ncbi:Dynein heavy chain family protein [Trichomonas vaginalis G3]|uniref:Dynein heavy chain family protein n=1 Tax=Trichomonas vaginalis (strain ATCC PRA-98 / G3) TaxID=412133 RepID=A2FU78_TRIV3|nr:dynein heavy chain family protein family [Trichomonas vaginalis G3]EAX91539.1 Dynein heavy chain family protein [Trichomonas vaginalis G3]KAI5509564.1 dynein heavy chain family protein family [Trichomonas vaginalis G3]|eukprot:XP_001304469.1 Dynein heavy chain family protein [Trichomonas vaginalis G3]